MKTLFEELLEIAKNLDSARTLSERNDIIKVAMRIAEKDKEVPPVLQKPFLFHLLRTNNPSDDKYIENLINSPYNAKLTNRVVMKRGTEDQKRRRMMVYHKNMNRREENRITGEERRKHPEYQIARLTRVAEEVQAELDNQRAKLIDPKYATLEAVTRREIAYRENQLAELQKDLSKWQAKLAQLDS